jgi:transcriptional regulator with XRE-family HTH domain
MDAQELGAALRAWRDRLDPASVGLSPGSRRRAPGLRRQEVAVLAGLTVDYLARLEQGRAEHPSPSVLEALARALRLSTPEHEHLFRVAGQASSRVNLVDRHITAGVQRLIDRLTDVPVMVLSAAWDLVFMNRLATALFGELPTTPRLERNLVWRYLHGLPDRFVRTEQERDQLEQLAVADLRSALGRYPHDPELRALLRDLRRHQRFEDRWQQAAVGEPTSSRKTIDHPVVGLLTLDCDILAVTGTGLRLVVYTADPASADAGTLALLATIGSQDMRDAAA